MQTNKDLVLDAINKLGADNARMTTLVVKNYLRSLHYYATQDTVSLIMHELADEGELEKRDLGQYHEFWLADKGPKHWSETKQKWLYLKDMHTLHIFNAMMKYMDILLKISFRAKDSLTPNEIGDIQSLATELHKRLREKTATQ